MASPTKPVDMSTIRADYESLPCAVCGDGLGNIHEGERLRECRYCGNGMHGHCARDHQCDAMKAADREKLARWTAGSDTKPPVDGGRADKQ